MNIKSTGRGTGTYRRGAELTVPRIKELPDGIRVIMQTDIPDTKTTCTNVIILLPLPPTVHKMAIRGYVYDEGAATDYSDCNVMLLMAGNPNCKFFTADPVPLYHVVSGKAYKANDGETEPALRERLRAAYGTLQGVKILRADNAADALVKSTRTSQGPGPSRPKPLRRSPVPAKIQPPADHGL